MGGTGDYDPTLESKLFIILVAAISVAALVTVYHCITAGPLGTLLRDRRTSGGASASPSRQQQMRHQLQQPSETPSSIENSLAELIPVHKYRKSGGLIGEGHHDDDDRLCSVCLCEFEDGEELRTLPECMHSFHAACIDMWLYSHPNCPVCRSEAMPSPYTSTVQFQQNLEPSNSNTL